jgi:histidinol phosphatase-like PHP family hydrolase
MDTDTATLIASVWIPATHFHMRGFVVPGDLAAGGPQAVGELLYRRFMEALEIEFATGIVHPLVPLGFLDWEIEILSNITPAMYEKCFTAAKEAGVAVEMNSHVIKSKTALAESGFSNLYIQMFSIARSCGCKFFFGSDAHRPDAITGYDRMRQFADICGIDESMELVL